jgi:protein-S-isoprenylcysteine O-methyltransferase Ste14
VEVKKLDLRYARVSWGDVIEAAAKLLLALMYGFFLYAFMKDFVENQRLSSLLFAIVESVFLYMSVTRRPPVELSTFGPAWLFAFVGTFSPLLLYPSSPSVDTNVGHVVQVAGVLLIGLSIASLGRSFGIVAANRGVVISGMYRWVRHPLYMAYFVNIAGFMINNISLNNVAIVFVLMFAQLARIQYEEKLLERDRAYAQYAERVRWRLIPYIY